MSSESSYATNLYCGLCGEEYDMNIVQKLCQCGKPLLVQYDLDACRENLSKEQLVGRIDSMWRYRELLPVLADKFIITLSEGGTPMLKSRRLAEQLEMSQLYLKDESQNPTGSFKARGLGMAVSRAHELGITKVIIPTAGNAGSALAAYAAIAGMSCAVVMPNDVPKPFRVDCIYHGAEVELVDGTIKDCGARVAERCKDEGWFPVSTLKEPYRIEGKKTMGYELAEQFNWTLPDVIIYPTGGGTGLIGMWKAFDEMEQLGWIGSARPRMISVQAEGCAPIPRAFESGDEFAQEFENPATIAAGLRVPSAVGDFLMLRAIRESKGEALSVSDDEIITGTFDLAKKEGLFMAPEAGATVAALKKLISLGKVDKDERVLLFLTGSGYKYLETLAVYVPEQ